MSVDGCVGESDFDFDWEDGAGFTSPTPAYWQGRLVAQQVESIELQSPQERAETLFRRTAPQIEAEKAQIDLEQYLFEKAKEWTLAHPGYSGPCSPWFPVKDAEKATSRWSQKNVEPLYFTEEEEPLDLSYRGPGFLEVLNALLTPDMMSSDYHIEHAIYRPEDPAMIVPCGFKKFVKKGCHDIGKFWRKHKVEIIVGGIVLGIVVAVIILDPFAAGPAIAGGGAILDQLRGGDSPDRDPLSCENPKPSFVPSKDPPQEERLLSSQEKWDQLLNSPYFTERDIKPDPSYVPPPEFGHTFPPPPPPVPPELASATPSHPIESSPAFPYTEIPPNLFFAPEAPKTPTGWVDKTLAYCKEKIFGASENLPTIDETGKHFQLERDKTLAYCKEKILDTSERLPTMGEKNKHLQILGINGIGTSKDEAIDHQGYIRSLLPETCPVDFIYNHSHTPVIDLVEALLYNYSGCSPNTTTLLRNAWQEFHENNKANPHKKFLQFCHSQGAIHVYNTLSSLPQEIRDRIIVVAIAPAKVIPEDMCYQAFNYASKNDMVPYGEIAQNAAQITLPNQDWLDAALKIPSILENQDELIWLDPHPDTKGLDHGFQSPTFTPTIQRHLNKHCEKKGEYND